MSYDEYITLANMWLKNRELNKAPYDSCRNSAEMAKACILAAKEFRENAITN